METAKIVDAHEGGLIPSSRGEGKDVSVDGENGAVKLLSQEQKDQHSSAVNVESQSDGRASRELRKRLSKILRIPRPKDKAETEKSRRKQSSTKRRNKTLRFSAEPKIHRQGEVENLNQARPSANPNPQRVLQGGRSPEKRPGQSVRRSSSTEVVGREAPMRSSSLFRSTSEQEYSTQVLSTRVAALAARNSSRRWRGDAFPTNEQEEEGELDSILRFIGECTQAVLNVLNDIPKIISELPKRTKEVLDRFFLLVQGRNVPLLEGPTSSNGAQ